MFLSVSETAFQLLLLRFPFPVFVTSSSHHPGALSRMKLRFAIFSLTCLPQEFALVGSDLSGSGIVETVSAVVAAVGDGARRVQAA